MSDTCRYSYNFMNTQGNLHKENLIQTLNEKTCFPSAGRGLFLFHVQCRWDRRLRTAGQWSDNKPPATLPSEGVNWVAGEHK